MTGCFVLTKTLLITFTSIIELDGIVDLREEEKCSVGVGDYVVPVDWQQ
jgi:hypothetical protein